MNYTLSSLNLFILSSTELNYSLNEFHLRKEGRKEGGRQETQRTPNLGSVAEVGSRRQRCLLLGLGLRLQTGGPMGVLLRRALGPQRRLPRAPLAKLL